MAFLWGLLQKDSFIFHDQYIILCKEFSTSLAKKKQKNKKRPKLKPNICTDLKRNETWCDEQMLPKCYFEYTQKRKIKRMYLLLLFAVLYGWMHENKSETVQPTDHSNFEFELYICIIYPWPWQKLLWKMYYFIRFFIIYIYLSRYYSWLVDGYMLYPLCSVCLLNFKSKKKR